MREPNLHDDGWALASGEERHAAAPETFHIPRREEREDIRVGDMAQLIFEISVDDEEEPVSVERMWVIVREAVEGRYFGILDNEPASITENDQFWAGTEVPFGPDHVIDLRAANNTTTALAFDPPLKSWPRD